MIWDLFFQSVTENSRFAVVNFEELNFFLLIFSDEHDNISGEHFFKIFPKKNESHPISVCYWYASNVRMSIQDLSSLGIAVRRL